MGRRRRTKRSRFGIAARKVIRKRIVKVKRRTTERKKRKQKARRAPMASTQWANGERLTPRVQPPQYQHYQEGDRIGYVATFEGGLRVNFLAWPDEASTNKGLTQKARRVALERYGAIAESWALLDLREGSL